MAHLLSIVDDLDKTTKARNVTFSIDGEVYDIHLSRANERRLRTVLKEFTAAGRLRTDAETPAQVPVLDPAVPAVAPEPDATASVDDAPEPKSATPKRSPRKKKAAAKKSTPKKAGSTRGRAGTKPAGGTKAGQAGAAAKVATPVTGTPDAQSTSTPDAEHIDSAKVRQWALENDVAVPPRGRVPNAVVEQYRAADSPAANPVTDAANPVTDAASSVDAPDATSAADDADAA